MLKMLHILNDIYSSKITSKIRFMLKCNRKMHSLHIYLSKSVANNATNLGFTEFAQIYDGTKYVRFSFLLYKFLSFSLLFGCKLAET